MLQKCTVIIRGVTVHRSHGSIRASVLGSLFDVGSVQHKEATNPECLLFLVYFGQAVVFGNSQLQN